MYTYISNVQLDFNFTDKNAQLAAEYCNFEDPIRSTTVGLIQRDANVKLTTYRWYFKDNQARIIATSEHVLTSEELKRLQQYTQNDVSDGIGENFSFQDFADIKNNLEVNPDNDYDPNYDDNDLITLNEETNSFEFTLKK